MNNLSILPNLLVDDKNFNFEQTAKVNFKNWPEFNNQIDVIYKGQRIAILNGLSAPLQWTVKNNSNIPNSIIDELEQLVILLIEETYYLQKINETK
jgi:hypothetical protein